MKCSFRTFMRGMRAASALAALSLCLCMSARAVPCVAAQAGASVQSGMTSSKPSAGVSRAPASEKAPAPEKAKSGWDFHEPDKSTLNARWKESLNATLKQTTFAPSSPAGRYLHRHKDVGDLPPARIEKLDETRPPEQKKLMLGDKAPITGEVTRERSGWRPDAGDASRTTPVTPAIREDTKAGAYADFHPDEDVELKLGPEYRFGASALRPDQTGRVKDNPGSLGMGMKLKIDF